MKKLPLYYEKYYAKIYENKDISKLLGLYWISEALSLFQRKKIVQSVLKDVRSNDNVLLIGISFGSLIDLLAQKAKTLGILDVSKTQIELIEEKYKYIHYNINYINQDAAKKINGKYDIVICNNLLHEVPIATKTAIVNNAVEATQKDGKTIFVDYHVPNKYFALKYFIRMFNRLYQPFAEKIWDRSIDTYAKEKLKYSWKKTTFFYGCFQKVVVKSRGSDV